MLGSTSSSGTRPNPKRQGVARQKSFGIEQLVDEALRRVVALVYERFAGEKEVETLSHCTSENVYRCYLALWQAVAHEIRDCRGAPGVAVRVPDVGVFVHIHRGDEGHNMSTGSGPAGPSGEDFVDLVFDRRSFSAQHSFPKERVTSGSLASCGPIKRFHLEKALRLISKEVSEDFAKLTIPVLT